MNCRCGGVGPGGNAGLYDQVNFHLLPFPDRVRHPDFKGTQLTKLSKWSQVDGPFMAVSVFTWKSRSGAWDLSLGSEKDWRFVGLKVSAYGCVAWVLLPKQTTKCRIGLCRSVQRLGFQNWRHRLCQDPVLLSLFCIRLKGVLAGKHNIKFIAWHTVGRTVLSMFSLVTLKRDSVSGGKCNFFLSSSPPPPILFFFFSFFLSFFLSFFFFFSLSLLFLLEY